MSKANLPKTDSIRELAEFWDTHDATEFAGELVEVAEPVFVRGTPITIALRAPEVKKVRRVAAARGLSPEELIRSWVLQQLAAPSNGRRAGKHT